ncbi:hypothetical protein PGT21_050191 [Puccinia graminis f. sp. tritici]|uniref:DUF4218 domain-containing protein n=1 Tax=Puccinia graminis f. sp. tritici TaxID=56615 RepID=A0A5B0PFA2_PUCGR|nr:hypothetical protein PGT21_050191 [Puccinia graminis f. sp. tritici]
MPPTRQTRRLCLCSVCSKSSHNIDGHRHPGKLLAYHTVTRHQLKERVAHPASSSPPASVVAQGLPHTQSQSSVVANPSTRTIPTRFSLINHPSVIHAMVSAAVLYLLEQVPSRAVELQLKSNFDLLVPFLLPPSSDPQITTAAISKLPKKIQTVMTQLDLDAEISRLVACPACFATYPVDSPPTFCTSTLTDELPGRPSSCGTALLTAQGSKPIPCRYFSFQSLPNWLTHFMSRPGIEDLLDQSLVTSRQTYDPSSVSDIHESLRWKSFRGIDGLPYTTQSGNLTFGMFIDGINPYGNKAAGKHASISFIVLVCLTLPISHRFLPQNIYLVGIAPGPKEPSLTQTNWILGPLVEDLKTLWSPGFQLPSTYRHREGRRIRCALMPFFADLPACRRTLGLASFACHKHMCSKCHVTKAQINTFDLNTIPKRSHQTHRELSASVRDASSYSDRQRIFKSHGIRYSTLCELDYWSIIDDHVIDPMHNLLLGTLAWHCKRFWKMTDQDDVEEAPASREVVNLITDTLLPPENQLQAETQESPENHLTDRNPAFLDISFQSTDPGDPNYSPTNEEFDIPMTRAIFDSDLLGYVNQRLTRIHIPSSISRAIPILGQASYGRLKADEWRNLFSIQLPLCLIPLWNGSDPYERCLLSNFCHLVSMVNLALKRIMTSDRIAKYRQHNRAYLESCVKLFPDCPLAPNHHMSLHIPECLEQLGPVRAWWSFPFERFMGQVVKSCHNNRIGQLETTFLTTFTRAARLRALLERQDLPESLSSLISHVINPIPSDPVPSEPISNLERLSYQPPLSDQVFHLLLDQINSLGPPNHVTSSQYQQLNRAERKVFHPITAKHTPFKHHRRDGITYSTFEANPRNSYVKLDNSFAANQQFGVIESIFEHTYHTINNVRKTFTWFVINPLPVIPTRYKNPFRDINSPEMQVDLRLPPSTDQPHRILLQVHSIEALCAWIRYGAGEVHASLKTSTIGLVSLNRN